MKTATCNHFQQAEDALTALVYGLAMQTWTLEDWVQCCLCDGSEGAPN